MAQAAIQPRWNSSAKNVEQTRVLDEVLRLVGEAVLRRPASRPVVTFDLDSTVFDNRPRQLAILSQFARWNGLGGVEDLEHTHIDGWRVTEMIAKLQGAAGREEALKVQFKSFWRERFFTSEFCLYDHALPGAGAYVQSVEATGGTVVYLTGRHEDMRDGTAKSLHAGGFPEGTLLMKPTFEMTDTQWKEIAVAKIRELGDVVASFDNETTHVNRLKAAFPSALVVWLSTDHSPEAEPLPPGTPMIEGFLR
jgi:hypothetical protein